MNNEPLPEQAPSEGGGLCTRTAVQRMFCKKRNQVQVAVLWQTRLTAENDIDMIRV